MDTKQEDIGPVLPTAVMPVEETSKSTESAPAGNAEVNYDFNFEKQTTPAPVAAAAVVVADPAIGQVNPNPVIPQNIIPVDVDTAAGAKVEKPVVKTIAAPVAQSTIKTSGTATEEEIVIDATKGTAEVLDEYAITMDAAAEKAKEKKNNIFIGVVFGVIILFIILLRVIIRIVGY